MSGQAGKNCPCEISDKKHKRLYCWSSQGMVIPFMGGGLSLPHGQAVKALAAVARAEASTSAASWVLLEREDGPSG